MNVIDLIGWIAAIMTSIFLVPQIFAVFKSKDVSDLSWVTLIISFTTPILWIIFGAYSKSLQIVFTDSCVLITSIIVFSYKIHQIRRDKKINYMIENDEFIYDGINIKNASNKELELLINKLSVGESNE